MIAIGLPDCEQQRVLVKKNGLGQLQTRGILDVAFVPLTGDTLIGRGQDCIKRVDQTNSDGERLWLQHSRNPESTS